MDTTRPSLLLRIRNLDDFAAWCTFNQLYRPLLIRYATANGLDDNSAEDVAQDCLESVARHIETFEYDPARGRFKAWLGALVRNRVRNLVRRRREQPGADEALDVAEDDAPGPDERFEQMWLEQHLWHCLKELEATVDPKTYRAYVGFVIEQRPLESICAELGLTSSNVYTIKWRMTQRIAARMRELLHDDDV